jgi:nucleotide-binding universal stress UspA family protein
MLQRILLVVSATGEALQAVSFVSELALMSKAQIIALNVVDSSLAQRVTTATGSTASELFVKLEQDGWRYLYDVEDIAKGQGAKIVLQQEEGFPDAMIVQAAKRFKADLVVVPRSHGLGHAQSRSERMVVALMDRLECPVMIV